MEAGTGEAGKQHPLARLTEEFDRWRAERVPGSRIPEALWDQDCRLEKLYGFGTIAHRCRLNSVQFRRRLQRPKSQEASRQVSKEPRSPEPEQFLDLGMPAHGFGDACAIEADVSQRRITIRLSKAGAAGACQLLDVLLSRMS